MNEIKLYFGKLEKALLDNRHEDFIELLENDEVNARDEASAEPDEDTYNELIKYFLKGIEIDNNNPNLYNDLCVLYTNGGMWDNIIELEHKIPNTPTACIAWWEVAHAYYATNRYAKVYSTVKKANKYKENGDTGIDYKYSQNTILFPKPIDRISINSYYSIENVQLENLSDKNEIYILGENGVGKTILLQAITLALKREYSQYNKTKYTSAFLQGEEKIDFFYLNTFAYGVGRLRTHKNKSDTTGYGTLFNNEKNVSLINPIDWLKEVDRLEKYNIGTLKLTNIIDLLNEVLSISPDKENDKDIKIELNSKSGEIVFKQKETKVSFEQLADGYRSILIVLADLLKRLTEYQPDVTNIKDYVGVVLIDEVDMLLHPKWEYAIVRKLRAKFPKIQWILSTHSPILILGASEDAVFYKLYKKEGKTKISNPFSPKTFSNKLLSSYVTSPLFNMQTAKSAAYKASDSDIEAGHYVYSIINKEVEKRLEKEPLQDDEVKGLVKQLLDEFEKDNAK